MQWSRSAKLCFLPPGSTTNDARYVDLLQEKLDLYMHILQCIISMHDSTTCQRSFRMFWQHRTNRWTSEIWTQFKNLWEIVKNCTEAAREAVEEVWTKEISVDYRINLILGLLHRLIEAAVKSKKRPYKILTDWRFCFEWIGMWKFNWNLLTIFHLRSGKY